jgi:hypothetical protein
MKTRVLLFIVFSLFLFTTCNKDEENEDECVEYHYAPVILVDGPSGGEVNDEIPIGVLFSCFNGCGRFSSFEESKSGNEIEIRVVAKYKGCTCTTDVPMLSSTYNFSAKEPGIYLLKFRKTDDLFEMDTIVIQ